MIYLVILVVLILIVILFAGWVLLIINISYWKIPSFHRQRYSLQIIAWLLPQFVKIINVYPLGRTY